MKKRGVVMYFQRVMLYGAMILSSATLLATKNANNSVECSHCGQSLSESFVSIAKKSRPAVVHINAEVAQGRHRSMGGFEMGPSNPFEEFQDELFQRFFGSPNPNARGQSVQPGQISTGSGFIVSSDGYIVTNHHLIKDATRITVEKFDESDSKFDADLVGCDPKTDLALLKINATGLPCLEFADSDEIQVGQWAMAIGHPFRLRDTVTVGVISATHRGDLQISQWEDFIQTDTSINPGNSGGPLLDLNGKVIGVNTAILSRTGGSIGVGFAVPSNIVSMVFEQIRQKGSVDRAYLGVQIQDLNDDLCEGFSLKKGTAGALISEVAAESAAEKAGLRSGDIVVEFNGSAVKNVKQLYTNIGKYTSGTVCHLVVLRDGRPLKISLTLGSKTPDISEEGDIIYKLGIMVEQITQENAHKYGVKSDEKGLVITKVLPQTMASMLSWTPGTVIMVVNGKKVNSIRDFKEVLEKADPHKKVVFLMNQNGRAVFQSFTHPNAR
jgi:serine protease Do